MSDFEDKVRMRAYEIWQRQGCTGDPEDHWYEAERELRGEGTPNEASENRSEATVEDASPREAVEAAESASGKPTG